MHDYDAMLRLETMRGMFLATQLYSWRLTSDHRLIDSNCPSEKFFYDLMIVSSAASIDAHFRTSSAPILVNDRLGIAWIAAADSMDDSIIEIHLLGPVFTVEASESYLRDLCAQLHISGKITFELMKQLKLVPVIPLNAALRYAVMLHCCINREQIGLADIAYVNSAVDSNLESEWSSTNWHGTWQAEQMMFEAIRTGTLKPSELTGQFSSGRVGTMCPGTEFNTYADGVYVSDHPLGPFTLQPSNPFSSKPGGFITGAGHGSTIQDIFGNYWHASTMRISVNHSFERRVGLFPAGFDRDGILFCNQNFADYPIRIPSGKFDPEAISPEWMLLSYRKPVQASSSAPDSDPALAVDEDIRTWWSAASPGAGEWLSVDLEQVQDVRAIQVNLADEGVQIELPPDRYGDERHTRNIEFEPQISHYVLEASLDGKQWAVLETVARECSNGYFEYPEGIRARYIRVTGGQLPYGQPLRVSGLRVFGNGCGKKPAKAEASAVRNGDLDAVVRWAHLDDAQGCNVRYGIAPDKLYQSWLVYGADEVTLTTLMAGTPYFIRVDSFNENGITPGDVFQLA